MEMLQGFRPCNTPVWHPKSLPPLPKPRCIYPSRRIGNGGSGVSGPTIGRRVARKLAVLTVAGDNTGAAAVSIDILAAVNCKIRRVDLDWGLRTRPIRMV